MKQKKRRARKKGSFKHSRYTINEEGSNPRFCNNLVYKVFKNLNMMKSSHKKHEIKGKDNVITEFMKKKTIELSKGEKTLLACGGSL
jgi:hypothetical protein